MPLYEYRCSKCSHQFEKIQKFSDPPVTECPKCKGEVEQLLSAPAIQFKGAGWYVNDYAKSGKTKSGDVKAESKSDSSSETKSESKPETKSSSSDASSSSSSKSSDSSAKS